MAVLILFNVIIPLIFGALKYVLFDRPSPTPEPVYPASESVIADEYVDGIPGYSYTVNDMNFIVGDMALLDTRRCPGSGAGRRAGADRCLSAICQSMNMPK